MREIKLMRTWFTPGNTLLKPGVHIVPDNWDAPSGTEELGEVEEAAPTKPARGKVTAA